MARNKTQSDVIRAIKAASDAELRALADISQQLGKMNGGSGPLRVVRAANAGRFRQPRSNELGQTLERVLTSTKQAQTSTESGTNPAQTETQTRTIPAQISMNTVRKTRRNLKRAVNESAESAAVAIIDSITADIVHEVGTKAAPKKRRVSNTTRARTGAASSPAAAAPAGHYYDDNGRLRDSSGRYASKQANDLVRKTRRSREEEDDTTETNGLLRKLVGQIGKGAANGLTEEGTGDLAANAAGMGVMWQAGKELATIVKDTGSTSIELAKFLNNGRKAIGNKPILRGFSANDARQSVTENREIKQEEAAKEAHSDEKVTHENQQKEIDLLETLVDQTKKNAANSGDGEGFISKILGGIGMGGFGLGVFKKLRDRLRGRKGRARAKGGESEEFDENGRRKTRPNVGDEIDELEDQIGGNGPNRHHTGKVAGEAEDAAEGAAKRRGRRAAVGAAEKGAESLAEGSLVKGGEGLLEKGALKAGAKIGLRAIPILGTIASVGLDAYQGWNDEEGLQQTFGKNAGNKEKASMALANVLDMGGLISGISNAVSAGFEAAGMDNVADFFSMNGSSGIAKQIDELIGGTEDKDDKRNKTLADWLEKISDGIKGLTPGEQKAGEIAQTFLGDFNAARAQPLQLANETVYNAKGEVNQARRARGWTYNPHALITLGGKNATARGIANNNPTNLNFANQPGAMREVGNGQARFASFATPEEGIRAAGNNLLHYQQQGTTTIRDILMKWAPPADNNNTGAYINTVVRTMGPGFTPDTVIDARNPNQTSKLIQAFAAYENGSFNMSSADVQKSLGNVQGGHYVGGWTDKTREELSKTQEGQAVLANNTGAGQAVVTGSGTLTPAANIPAAPEVKPVAAAQPATVVNAPLKANAPAKAPVTASTTSETNTTTQNAVSTFQNQYRDQMSKTYHVNNITSMAENATSATTTAQNTSNSVKTSNKTVNGKAGVKGLQGAAGTATAKASATAQPGKAGAAGAPGTATAQAGQAGQAGAPGSATATATPSAPGAPGEAGTNGQPGTATANATAAPGAGGAAGTNGTSGTATASANASQPKQANVPSVANTTATNVFMTKSGVKFDTYTPNGASVAAPQTVNNPGGESWLSSIPSILSNTWHNITSAKDTTEILKSLAGGVNGVASSIFPQLNYSNANAGLGLSAVKRTQIQPVLNADAMVNAATKNTLPTPAAVAQPQSQGILSGALSDTFKNATQAINGQNIMGALTSKLSPQWQYALNPLTTAAGNGMNSVINLARDSVTGWMNGTASNQKTVSDLSANGARLGPDKSTLQAQSTQQSLLEEIAGYLEQMLGIQKNAPKGDPDKTKPGPQPGPTGQIPLQSSSSVMQTVIKRSRS